MAETTMNGILLGLGRYKFPDGETGEEIKGCSVHCALDSSSKNFKGMEPEKFNAQYELFDHVDPKLLGKWVVMKGNLKSYKDKGKTVFKFSPVEILPQS